MINRIIFLIFVVVIISIFYSCKNNPINSDSSIDISSLNEIFPISVGKSYLYSYYRYYSPRTSDYFNSDSGTIQYVILDSIKLSNTVVQWQIKEIQHLYHSQLISYSDTATNLIDTTNMFSIEEELKNLHELKCKSVAWNFPFIDSVYSYPEWIKTDPQIIYRYSSNDNNSISNSKYINPNLLQDTLAFYANKGMTYYRRDYEVQVMSGYYETLRIKLIN